MDPNLDAYALKKQNSLLGAFAQRLTGGLMGGPQMPPVQAAQQTLMSRPYQLHVQEMQSQGLQPLPPDQWAQQQGQKLNFAPQLGR